MMPEKENIWMLLDEHQVADEEAIIEKTAAGVQRAKLGMRDTQGRLGGRPVQTRVYLSRSSSWPHCSCDRFRRNTRHIERNNYLMGLSWLKEQSFVP